MRNIYLDNSATTAVSEVVAKKMSDILYNCSGNPSSVHAMGIEAEKLVSEARARVISSLGIKNQRSGSLIFCGSGTEADNMAFLGTAFTKKHRSVPRIIITDSEHPAVENPAKYLEQRGFEVIRLSTKGGVIDLNGLEAALTPDTVLVSLMLVNNETGAIYDVKNAFELVKRISPNTLTHTDAVQGYMKIPSNPEKLGADMISLSAHKINGPKGVGALWCSAHVLTSKKLQPIIYGGGQENGYRSGTENVYGIAGFGEAAAEKADKVRDNYEYVASLRSRLLEILPDDVRVNTPSGMFLPNIISITLPKIKSEVMVRYLSGQGIYVSAGSACSARHKKKSSTLIAFGLTESEADSTIRVSMSAENTAEELEAFADSLANGIRELQKMR